MSSRQPSSLDLPLRRSRDKCVRSGCTTDDDYMRVLSRRDSGTAAISRQARVTALPPTVHTVSLLYRLPTFVDLLTDSLSVCFCPSVLLSVSDDVCVTL